MSESYEIKKFDEWQKYREFIEENFRYNKRFIFRGQRDETWPLQTTFDRLIEPVRNVLKRESLMLTHQKRFEKAIRGRRGANPKVFESGDELWAMGQHYGLATPLLDWSRSPFIATYFAFTSNKCPSSGYRCVWALNELALDEANQEIRGKYGSLTPEEKEKYFEKTRAPVVDLVEPSLEDNPRIINQVGLFTRGPVLYNLDDWVIEFAINYKKVALYKIILPDSERETILATLDQMNINAASLFPDINGACLYCNETLALRANMFNTKKTN
jgi:hypothetical protein